MFSGIGKAYSIKSIRSRNLIQFFTNFSFVEVSISAKEIIKDKSFYINWIKSEDGEKIANNGKEYVRKKFGLERVEVFVDIISSL